MKIAEVFTSIQGEGHLTGKVMHFIRTAGCDVDCPIRKECDEQEALKFTTGEEVSASDLVINALDAVGKGGWVCLTGGEPTSQPDFQEYRVQIGSIQLQSPSQRDQYQQYMSDQSRKSSQHLPKTHLQCDNVTEPIQ